MRKAGEALGHPNLPRGSASPSCGGCPSTAPDTGWCMAGSGMQAGRLWVAQEVGTGRLQRLWQAEGNRQQEAGGQRQGGRQQEAGRNGSLQPPPLPAASPLCQQPPWQQTLAGASLSRSARSAGKRCPHTVPAHAWPGGRGRELAGGKNPIPMWGPAREPWRGAPQGCSPSAGPLLTRLVLLPKSFGLLMAGGGGRKNIQQTIAKVKPEQEGGREQGELPNPAVFLGDADNNGRNI